MTFALLFVPDFCQAIRTLVILPPEIVKLFLLCLAAPHSSRMVLKDLNGGCPDLGQVWPDSPNNETTKDNENQAQHAFYLVLQFFVHLILFRVGLADLLGGLLGCGSLTWTFRSYVNHSAGSSSCKLVFGGRFESPRS